MWQKILSVFTGGAFNSIEKIALEYIDTDKETAEAKSMLVKVLDPNGKMRRDLSRFASIAYAFYLVNAVILMYMVAFNIGDSDGANKAASMITDLFLPITTSWAAIVSASFGVNGLNSSKGK